MLIMPLLPLFILLSLPLILSSAILSSAVLSPTIFSPHILPPFLTFPISMGVADVEFTLFSLFIIVFFLFIIPKFIVSIL